MHSKHFFETASKVCGSMPYDAIEKLAKELSVIKGRVFILGVGGSAGNAGHAVNDFRKLCDIEAYAPTDNVSELTARTNDEGWDTVFSGWLKVSKFNKNDALLILSVGGGNERKKVSVNLIRAIKLAKALGAKVYGIVGKPDGYTANYANIAIVIPSPDAKLVTPMSEAFQALVWHALVSHPAIQRSKTKW